MFGVAPPAARVLGVRRGPSGPFTTPDGLRCDVAINRNASIPSATLQFHQPDGASLPEAALPLWQLCPGTQHVTLRVPGLGYVCVEMRLGQLVSAGSARCTCSASAGGAAPQPMSKAEQDKMREAEETKENEMERGRVAAA